jgi:predicted dehydrogenase
MANALRFGILGAAKIAPSALIQPAAQGDEAVVSCVAARDQQRARAFAREHGIPRALASYADVVADPEIDVVYNPLPMHLHEEWTIAALRAGKHVLCEKPFAANAEQAREMVRVAAETDLFLMEAFHYRYHPLFERVMQIVRSGQLGPLTRLDAEFNALIQDRNDLRHRYDTAGGATMDLGCYPLHWMRQVAGSEPRVVSASAVQGEKYVDVTMQAQLEFDGGLPGELRTSLVAPFSAVLKVEGERGSLMVDNPMQPHNGHRLVLTVEGRTSEEKVDGFTTYRHQLIAFAAALRGDRRVITMGDDSIANMTLIDSVYRAAGLPVRGTPL